MKVGVLSELADQSFLIGVIVGFFEASGDAIDQIDKIAMLQIDDRIPGFII
jgi:hypothetical protein